MYNNMSREPGLNNCKYADNVDFRKSVEIVQCETFLVKHASSYGRFRFSRVRFLIRGRKRNQGEAVRGHPRGDPTCGTRGSCHLDPASKPEQ